MIIRRLLLFAGLSYYFSHISGSQTTHFKSKSSRFGQQDLYLPALIEILMIYFFQYGSFGGNVLTAIIIVLRVQCDKLPLVVTWHFYGSLKTRLCGKQHPFWKSTRCKWFRSLFAHVLCQLTLLNYAWIFFKHSNASSCQSPKISLSLRKSLLWEIVTITLSIWHVQWWGTGGEGMLKQEHTRNTLQSQETKHTRNTGKTPEENAEHRL